MLHGKAGAVKSVSCFFPFPKETDKIRNINRVMVRRDESGVSAAKAIMNGDGKGGWMFQNFGLYHPWPVEKHSWMGDATELFCTREDAVKGHPVRDRVYDTIWCAAGIKKAKQWVAEFIKAYDGPGCDELHCDFEPCPMIARYHYDGHLRMLERMKQDKRWYSYKLLSNGLTMAEVWERDAAGEIGGERLIEWYQGITVEEFSAICNLVLYEPFRKRFGCEVSHYKIHPTYDPKGIVDNAWEDVWSPVMYDTFEIDRTMHLLLAMATEISPQKEIVPWVSIITCAKSIPKLRDECGVTRFLLWDRPEKFTADMLDKLRRIID